MSGTPGVLFDLDGTLLADNIFEPQAAALTEAITEVYQFDAGTGPDDVPPDVQVDWTGQTDLGIVAAMCGRAGLTMGEIDAQLSAYVEEYETRFLGLCPPTLTERVTRGMEGVLEELCMRGWPLRIVTGNLRVVAYMKLRRAGLAEYFDLKPSGTGDEGRNRADIVRHAMTGLDAAVVVGDTWRDIAAAHEAGLPCVALKTDRHTVDSLAKADVLALTVDDIIPGLEALLNDRLEGAA